MNHYDTAGKTPCRKCAAWGTGHRDTPEHAIAGCQGFRVQRTALEEVVQKELGRQDREWWEAATPHQKSSFVLGEAMLEGSSIGKAGRELLREIVETKKLPIWEPGSF
jgi:hypothetical protein